LWFLVGFRCRSWWGVQRLSEKSNGNCQKKKVTNSYKRNLRDFLIVYESHYISLLQAEKRILRKHSRRIVSDLQLHSRWFGHGRISKGQILRSSFQFKGVLRLFSSLELHIVATLFYRQQQYVAAPKKYSLNFQVNWTIQQITVITFFKAEKASIVDRFIKCTFIKNAFIKLCVFSSRL